MVEHWKSVKDFNDLYLISNLQTPIRNENNVGCKLSCADIIDIKKIYGHKEMNTYELAEKYNVSRPLISLIVNNKRRQL